MKSRCHIALKKFCAALFCCLVVSFLFPNEALAAKFKSDFKLKSKNYADSTRKDYYDLVYDETSWDPIITPRSFDKPFYATINDLSFTLKGDLTKTQILDFRETLHYQRYSPEDYDAYALDTNKYTYLDHYFNMTYGLSLGKKDALQFDYINSIYRIPIDNLGEYTSHLGKARFNHKITGNSSMGFEGDFEDRSYQNDESSSYRERTMLIDYSHFFPEKIRYRPVSSASRGKKSTFEKTPSGMNSKKAVDYYTSWTTKPNDPEPQAKYIPQVVRGDLYINLTGDFRKRERYNIDSSYLQNLGTFKATYDANDKLKFNFEDTYYAKNWETESNYYYLYSQKSNKVSLSTTFKPDKMFTHIVTGSNEFYDHVTAVEQDYKINTLIWETYYYYNRTSAGLYYKTAWQSYGQPRDYYPTSVQRQGVFTYDYTLTKDLFLHLKDDWVNYDYLDNESIFYSTYTRNIWKLSFEKVLDKHNALELGYQDKREKHKNFYSNDITEKTVFLSWTASI